MTYRTLTVLLAGAVLTLLIAATPLFAGACIAPLQPFPAISTDAIAHEVGGQRCAIVVLSAGRAIGPEYGGETIDALSLQRLRYGAYLARATKLPILLSGGLGDGELPLARLMADALTHDYGISPRWLEQRSRTTAENAIDSAAMLHTDGVGCAVLVTHAWHMPRALAAFVANGLHVIAAPTAFYDGRARGLPSALIPNLSSLRMTGYAAHEAIGRLWYRVRYGYS